jgi:transcription termination/antitermination protein NusG
MGNLATNEEFQRLIRESELATQRNLSRYGSRESVQEIPAREGLWFALRCCGREEVLAAAGLVGRGFVVYLPTVWIKERPRRGSVREVERPMFSTYLFLRCLPRSDYWERARNVAGVQDFVGEAGPQYVPDGAIDEVRNAEACLATKSGRKSLRWPFEAGDHVLVKEGPFAYFRAQIESAVDDHGRISALVNVFGRFTRTFFDADQLERL